jgi:hypothetical protein
MLDFHTPGSPVWLVIKGIDHHISNDDWTATHGFVEVPGNLQ